MASIRPAVVADQPFVEIEELQGLIAQGTERGYLTFEEIASTLEEVEVTKEQVSQLHAHLAEQGVDVIEADGMTAYKESKEDSAAGQWKKQEELDVQVEVVMD